MTLKDGSNDFIIHGKNDCINHEPQGTKAAANYDIKLNAGESRVIKLRLEKRNNTTPFTNFDRIFDSRLKETNEFYEEIQKNFSSEDDKSIQRQAFAGLLWSKQFYYYEVDIWLDGDPSQPKPPLQRKKGRNHEWRHLRNGHIISMPDKWEYPWYAAWDCHFQ